MKTEEELLKIIRDNEYVLEHKARFIFLDRENDEIIVELTVMLASPKVGEEGEILEPNYHQIRHAVRLKLKFSDFFMLPPGGEPPQRDINYTMQKLEEALKKVEELQEALPRCHVCKVRVGQEHELYCSVEPGEYTAGAAKILVDSRARFVCSHATGKHDQECDLVSGLSAELRDMEQRRDAAQRRGDHLEDKCLAIGVSAQSRVTELEKQLQDAREEVFDLYHQACLVHPNSSDDPIREFQYDNMCLSTYESIEEKLIEWGMLKPEQCLRRPLKTNLLKDTLMKVPVDPAPVTPEWEDEEKK